eukprot:g29001.t1
MAERKDNPTQETIRKHSRYRQIVKKVVKQEKRKYVEAQLELTKDSPKAQAAILRQIVPRNSTARESPQETICNNVSYKRPIDIANRMNEHFINSGKRVSEALGAHPPAHVQGEGKQRSNPPAFALTNTTEEIIGKVTTLVNLTLFAVLRKPRYIENPDINLEGFESYPVTFTTINVNLTPQPL